MLREAATWAQGERVFRRRADANCDWYYCAWEGRELVGGSLQIHTRAYGIDVNVSKRRTYQYRTDGWRSKIKNTNKKAILIIR